MSNDTYYLDLFSGIGGFALAAYWAGLRFNKHYFSEIDSYAIELYQKRFPNAIPLGDITKINFNKLGIENKNNCLITAGFPCQPHSIAGIRRGKDDKRNLWPECFRAISEIRPEVAFFENVPGILNSNAGEFFNRVLSDISSSGYDAEWQFIQASDVGAPHKRKRLWIIAYPSGKRSVSDKMEKEICSKKTRENPEWKMLQSISCGINTMDNWEAYESFLTGNYDGIPQGLDRIKGAGNAIVPQCAELIFNLPLFNKWRIND